MQSGYITQAELDEAYARWQDVLREELLKVGMVGFQQPLVHNGRIVLEADGRKAFVNKCDNRVLVELAERYLLEWQQAKKLVVTTHADGDTIDGIPRQHALVLDRREIDEECIAEMRAAYERSIARRATIIDAEPIRGS